MQTKKQGLWILECAHNHWNISGNEHFVFTVAQIFEVLFDDRFDDDSRKFGNFEFSGFNVAKKIAYTCVIDKTAYDCSITSKKWCQQNNFTYIEVPRYVKDKQDKPIPPAKAREENIVFAVCQLIPPSVVVQLFGAEMTVPQLFKYVENKRDELRHAGKCFKTRL